MANVLLTGASSFSGLWIAEALAADGHAVTAPLRRARADYDGLRLDRVRRLETVAEVAFDHPIGSSRLDALVSARPWAALAHHAADIPNYREATYDPAAGFLRNVEGAPALVAAMARQGARAVIVTGTTFEAGEGEATPDSLAVSPYGLSKGLTNQAWRHFVRWQGLSFGKFVIAAPFGRWEESRFVWSLMQNWVAGRPGDVRTPAYVRDNLPAPLLGRAYAGLLAALLSGGQPELVARPSGFVGPQGEFAHRVAREMGPRLGLACDIAAADQREFPEPRRRVNDQPAIPAGWDEAGFWDDYAAYYRDVDARGLLRARPA